LLATGCYEGEDPGITRFGRQAIAEMNRVGMVVDMSHSAERSTLGGYRALGAADRHHPRQSAYGWHAALTQQVRHGAEGADASRAACSACRSTRTTSRDGSNCTLESFCAMVAETASRYGVAHLGIGSDLCQDQPDSVVAMDAQRPLVEGHWTTARARLRRGGLSAGSRSWFTSNADLGNLRHGLREVGFCE
jgi:membrane dipeptidase